MFKHSNIHVLHVVKLILTQNLKYFFVRNIVSN